LKLFIIIPVLLIIFTTPNVFAQMQGEQAMFGIIPEQSLVMEISASGQVHVTHNVQSESGTRYVEFLKGAISNLEVHDKNGEEVEFGKAGYGDVGGVQIYTSSPVMVKYNLAQALEFENGLWKWNYLYPADSKFYLPEKVDFVYVNDRYADLGGGAGLSCHGCGIDLAYYVNAESTIKNIEWESEKFPVEVISQNKLINFNFIQSDKIISFETENAQLVTLKIPLELLWNPYQVYFIENNEKSTLISPQNVTECTERQDKITIQGTSSCYDKIFNNEIEVDEKNVLLTIHPKKEGTVIILGTSAIPEFPLFMPLVIGILMVVLLQFRRKLNFNFSSIP